MCVCIYIYIYVYVYICIYIYIYIYIHTYIHPPAPAAGFVQNSRGSKFVPFAKPVQRWLSTVRPEMMCVYIYIYTYVCVYIYIYIYVCIHRSPRLHVKDETHVEQVAGRLVGANAVLGGCFFGFLVSVFISRLVCQ